jgi:hypothetical protein
MIIKAHCSDGTDQNCCQTVQHELPFFGLNKQNVRSNWVQKVGKRQLKNLQITPPPGDQWIIDNDQWLDYTDVHSIKETGSFIIDYDDLSVHCCGACGSDQTYNADGENISSL